VEVEEFDLTMSFQMLQLSVLNEGVVGSDGVQKGNAQAQDVVGHKTVLVD
jgi:hypothetical protein